MPRNTRRARRSTGARIGRPPKPDAGNWEKFYVLLKLPVAAYVRAEAERTGHSLSSIIGELCEEGVSVRLAQAEPAETPL